MRPRSRAERLERFMARQSKWLKKMFAKQNAKKEDTTTIKK